MPGARTGRPTVARKPVGSGDSSRPSGEFNVRTGTTPSGPPTTQAASPSLWPYTNTVPNPGAPVSSELLPSPQGSHDSGDSSNEQFYDATFAMPYQQPQPLYYSSSSVPYGPNAEIPIYGGHGMNSSDSVGPSGSKGALSTDPTSHQELPQPPPSYSSQEPYNGPYGDTFFGDQSFDSYSAYEDSYVNGYGPGYGPGEYADSGQEEYRSLRDLSNSPGPEVVHGAPLMPSRTPSESSSSRSMTPSMTQSILPPMPTLQPSRGSPMNHSVRSIGSTPIISSGTATPASSGHPSTSSVPSLGHPLGPSGSSSTVPREGLRSGGFTPAPAMLQAPPHSGISPNIHHAGPQAGPPVRPPTGLPSRPADSSSGSLSGPGLPFAVGEMPLSPAPPDLEPKLHSQNPPQLRSQPSLQGFGLPPPPPAPSALRRQPSQPSQPPIPPIPLKMPVERPKLHINPSSSSSSSSVAPPRQQHPAPRPLSQSNSQQESPKSDRDFGIGIGSAYVQYLRSSSGQVHSTRAPTRLPLGIRASTGKQPALSVPPTFLRKAMDIRYTHLQPRMLASEIDDDEGEVPQQAPSDHTQSTSSTPNSPTESVMEDVGRIKLFVANPDD